LKEWQYDQPSALYEAVHQLEMRVFEGLDIEKSKEAGKPVYQSIYKRFIFYDAMPKKGGKDMKLFGPDAITPHTAGPLINPKPLLFLKVLPKVTYAFRFGTRQTLADHYSSSIDETVKLLANVLYNMGIGAKINVGYGVLNFDAACYGQMLYNATKAPGRLELRQNRTNTNEA
jgi:CRISPR type III-B/RAMP module RAMP protein Cmr6